MYTEFQDFLHIDTERQRDFISLKRRLNKNILSNFRHLREGSSMEFTNTSAATHLLILTIGENPVLLLGVEEHAVDIEVQPIFLISGSFIRTDQQTALNLRVSKQHNLCG